MSLETSGLVIGHCAMVKRREVSIQLLWNVQLQLCFTHFHMITLNSGGNKWVQRMKLSSFPTELVLDWVESRKQSNQITMNHTCVILPSRGWTCWKNHTLNNRGYKWVISKPLTCAQPSRLEWKAMSQGWQGQLCEGDVGELLPTRKVLAKTAFKTSQIAIVGTTCNSLFEKFRKGRCQTKFGFQ